MTARGAVAAGGATAAAAVTASAVAQQPRERERLRDGREPVENENANEWMRIVLNFGQITIDTRPHM